MPQPSRQLQTAKSLFTSLENALFLGDRLSHGQFGVLMQPGQFVSPNIREEDSTDDMWTQSDLCNEALDSSFLYKPLTYRVGQIYHDILHTSAVPRQASSDDEQEELESLREWVSNHEQLYTQYQRDHYDVLDAYDAERASESPSGARLRRLRSKFDDSLTLWRTLGYKDEYENKSARFAYLSRGGPDVLLNKLRQRLAFQTKHAPTKGEYFQTFLTPPIAEWNSPFTSWGAFEHRFRGSESHGFSRATAWSGRAGARWGLFSVRGGVSGSRQFEHHESEATNISIKFEYLRVRIHRPWMVPDLFGYGFWTWSEEVNYRQLSDGGNLQMTPPERPIGEMPIRSTHLIVARNLTLSANFSESDRTHIASQMTTGVSAGWGPFSFSGSYSESTNEHDVRASFDGTRILVQHPQIIGFACQILPRCPNPDRSLPWQGDHRFAEDELDLLQKSQKVREQDYVLGKIYGQDVFPT